MLFSFHPALLFSPAFPEPFPIFCWFEKGSAKMPLGKGKTSKLANKMRGEWVGRWVLVIKTEVCWLRECWYIKWNEILLSETMKLLKKKICKLLRFPHVRVKWKGDFPPSISAFYQRQVSTIISFNKYFTAWLIAPSTFWIPVATGGPESLTPK